MIKLTTPNGLEANVPELDSEDITKKFNIEQLTEIKDYYDSEGYVIIKNLISKDICNKARFLWETEVKPFKGYIYRQAGTRAEKNLFNDRGWVMNPILNLQSLNPKFFGELRSHSENQVFSNPNLKKVF